MIVGIGHQDLMNGFIKYSRGVKNTLPNLVFQKKRKEKKYSYLSLFQDHTNIITNNSWEIPMYMIL